jgi:hypothetical protein
MANVHPMTVFPLEGSQDAARAWWGSLRGKAGAKNDAEYKLPPKASASPDTNAVRGYWFRDGCRGWHIPVGAGPCGRREPGSRGGGDLGVKIATDLVTQLSGRVSSDVSLSASASGTPVAHSRRLV